MSSLDGLLCKLLDRVISPSCWSWLQLTLQLVQSVQSVQCPKKVGFCLNIESQGLLHLADKVDPVHRLRPLVYMSLTSQGCCRSIPQAGSGWQGCKISSSSSSRHRCRCNMVLKSSPRRQRALRSKNCNHRAFDNILTLTFLVTLLFLTFSLAKIVRVIKEILLSCSVLSRAIRFFAVQVTKNLAGAPLSPLPVT